MPTDSLDVLYEDNHLLIINKRADLISQGSATGEESLVTVAKDYIKTKYAKPGNVYLGVVSRLDRLATGAIVLARTSKAAARLTEQFRDRKVEKIYWAVVEGQVEPPEASCVDWLWHNDNEQRVVVVDGHHRGAQEATLTFQRLGLGPQHSVLQIKLGSGRKHQIRVQLAARGFPILGDRKYGSRRPFAHGIALHSRELAFEHPVSRERIHVVAPTPKPWQSIISGT